MARIINNVCILKWVASIRNCFYPYFHRSTIYAFQTEHQEPCLQRKNSKNSTICNSDCLKYTEVNLRILT